MTESKKKRRTRKITPEQLGLIRGLWEAGIGTKRDIAEDVGVSFDQVDYAISKHGWIQGARAEYYEQKAREAIEKEMDQRAQKLMKDRERVKNQAVIISDMIENRMIKAFKNVEKEELSDETALGTMKTLECASRIAQNTFHVKRFALGMDRDEHEESEEFSQIEILEMTADDVEEIRAQQERDLTEMDVTSADA